jgi:hypothetical protein
MATELMASDMSSHQVQTKRLSSIRWALSCKS